MTGHQELINSDVRFNNTQLQLQQQGYMDEKLMAQNVQMHEQKAIFSNGLPK